MLDETSLEEQVIAFVVDQGFTVVDTAATVVSYEDEEDELFFEVETTDGFVTVQDMLTHFMVV